MIAHGARRYDRQPLASLRSLARLATRLAARLRRSAGSFEDNPIAAPDPISATLATLVVGSLVAILPPLVVARRAPTAIVDRARVVLAVIAAVSIAAAIVLIETHPLAFRIHLDPSEEPLLARGDPARQVYEEAVLNFGDDDLYVIGMQTPDVFTDGQLSALREIGRDVRRIGGVRALRSLVDVTDYRYDANQDMVVVAPLIDDIPQDSASLARLRARATTHPLYERSIVSPDGRTGAINVSFRPMTDGQFVAERIDDRIAAILARHFDGDRRFFVTGRQHIKARAHAIMVHDLLVLIPLAVAVGATIAWIFTGSLASGILPVATSLVATLWAFGVLAWLGRPLNVITIVFGPTLICVGSVYGVHVMSLHRELVEGGTPPPAAAARTIEYAFAPLMIAGATTWIGFSALLLSATPAIRELGALSMLGVGLATTLALTALPAVLRLMPASALRVHPGRAGNALDRALDAVSALVRARPGLVLTAWSLLTVVGLALIPRIVVDSDYLTFFDPSSDVRRDFAAASHLLVGAVPLYVTVDGGEEGAFREPDNLRAVERLQHRIGALDAVSATTSVVDLVRTVNRTIEKDDPAAERIPDTRGEVADVLFLLPKNELRRFANSNHSKVNIVVRTGRSGSAAILELERDIRREIAAADLPIGLHADVTGNAIVVNRSAEGIARNQLSTVGAATAAILVIVSYAFGSIPTGLLAMIPNVVPVVLFFGMLGAGAASLSLPTSLIGCVALGIAVDDTAHFLVGYRRRRGQGMTTQRAVGDCVATLGRPIATTSLMLIGGFCVLSLSGFATLREFGYLTAATMFVCVCADLTLLPAILLRVRA